MAYSSWVYNLSDFNNKAVLDLWTAARPNW